MRKDKKAVIELYGDESAIICSAFDATAYEAYDEDEDGPPPIYQSVLAADADADDSAIQRQVTLEVLGWLWNHGYTGAKWGDGRIYGEFEERPPWAKKDEYVWGELSSATEDR
jgi:hypothetical protein